MRSDASDRRRCQIAAPIAAAIDNAETTSSSRATWLSRLRPCLASASAAAARCALVCTCRPVCGPSARVISSLTSLRVAPPTNIHFKGARIGACPSTAIIGGIQYDRTATPSQVGRDSGHPVAFLAGRGGQCDSAPELCVQRGGELLRDGDPASRSKQRCRLGLVAADDLAGGTMSPTAGERAMIQTRRPSTSRYPPW